MNGLTNAGDYTGSASPNGTFDQGGNVTEWNEEIVSDTLRGLRGGSWSDTDAGKLWAASYGDGAPAGGGGNNGFRVASIPEPAQVLLVVTGALVLAVARRQRRA